jgi:hypothetical protein
MAIIHIRWALVRYEIKADDPEEAAKLFAERAAKGII